MSVFQYFKMNPELFEDYEGASHALFCFEVLNFFLLHYLANAYIWGKTKDWKSDGKKLSLSCQHFSSSEPCLSAYQAPVDPSTVLGGFTGNNYSQVFP